MHDETKTSISNNHAIELDLMKFYGILLVVIGHITRMYTDVGFIQPLIHSVFLEKTCAFIYCFHMPLFTFVSGCVFSYQCEIKRKEYTLINIISKKFKRLIIPYIFFGFFIVAPFMYIFGYENNYVDYIFNGIILSKNCRHLWFLLMLFGVFIFFIIIQNICLKLHLKKYWLLIISILFYIISFIIIIPSTFQLKYVFRYLLWFSLGYTFIIYKELINEIIYKFIIPLSLLILFSTSEKHISELMSPLVSVAGIFLIYAIAVKSKALSDSTVFKIISNNSMGIYLFHVVIIYMCFHFTKHLETNPYLFSFLVFINAIFFSILLTILMRKLHLNFALGEQQRK